jgi:hypothetical protein
MGGYQEEYIFGFEGSQAVITNFPLKRHGPHRSPRIILLCRGNVSTELLPSNDRATQSDPQTLF